METNTTGVITSAQLHENYIKLSKLVHPDLNPNDPDASLKFQELNTQYIKFQEILDKKQTHYQTSVSITLKESILGCKRYFVTDNGQQRFQLLIPAGVKNKQTIMFKDISVESVKNVVLHIKVYINIPPNFKVIGERLILVETVPFWKLIFGKNCLITSPTEEKIPVKLPKKTKNGKIFQVKNIGLYNRLKKHRDPLYIQFFGSII